MTKKSEVHDIFTQFRALVENYFNTKIKTLKTDWGGEYINLPLLGIQHQVSCLHTLEQNGFAKRRHRQIVETGLTLLANSSMFLKYRDDAFVSAVDVNNAFLHGILSEQVYMKQPPGFKSSTSPSDVCTCNGAIQNVIDQLHVEFALNDMGHVHYFLGIEVNIFSSDMHLNQSKYIAEILTKSNMEGAKLLSNPISSTGPISVSTGDPFSDHTLYRSIVGALQYLTIRRPDISFAVNRACQFMHNPTEAYWQAVKCILRYLKGSITHGLLIQPLSSFHLSAYAYFDWAGCPDTRRSTNHFFVFLWVRLSLAGAPRNRRWWQVVPASPTVTPSSAQVNPQNATQNAEQTANGDQTAPPINGSTPELASSASGSSNPQFEHNPKYTLWIRQDQLMLS
ncbi:transmembrane signal receptor [Lithospermum erythrorhizon]|uniref:Transmembrane signal receptor n=1 Tax=Lithospermum erythrorhizon TaxID=34254 RepID=A0AAV3P0U2_LITER